jgi:hypothetical protein
MGGFLTMEGSRVNGPYLSVSRRYGSNYSQIYDVARLGRLNGFLDYTDEAEEYGLGVGDAIRYMTYDPTNGLRIRTRSGATSFDDEGITTDMFSLASIITAPDYVDGKVFLYFDEATGKIRGKSKLGAVEDDFELGGAGSGGDVVGPSSAVNNRIAIFNGITGKLITDGGSQISDLALSGHDHELAYSALGHDHASDYAALSHSHSEYILHSLATAANDFLVASGSGAMIKKTLAETKTILNVATQVVQVLLNTSVALAIGNDKARIRIPTKMNGLNLIAVATSRQSGTGVPSIMIRNATDSQDMLSTAITIDTAETDSLTAAIAAVINTSYDDVATGDQIAIDVDGAGTNTLMCIVELTFG